MSPLQLKFSRGAKPGQEFFTIAVVNDTDKTHYDVRVESKGVKADKVQTLWQADQIVAKDILETNLSVATGQDFEYWVYSRGFKDPAILKGTAPK